MTLIRKILYFFQPRAISKIRKKIFFEIMERRKKRILEDLRGKERIRVLFLVIHKSIWKLDSVFKQMLQDSYFDPQILVCPSSKSDYEDMVRELDSTYDYFKAKGYSVSKSLQDNGKWVELRECSPDLLFFTNPHNITMHEYYGKAYCNYLSCYAGYGVPISRYDNYQSQYNQDFHLAVWKIFVAHNNALQISRKYSSNLGRNVELTGDTTIESIVANQPKDVWKKQVKELKRIIWAPHHTITSKHLPYSNFLYYAHFFKNIVMEYKEFVQFAFKPHPLLKQKLYEHADWGIDRTNEYYNFWDAADNAQLEEVDYIDLFGSSSALIHDSGAFLGEYIYTGKPVLYLAKEEIEKYFNDFAIDAYSVCYKSFNEEGIVHFIENVIAEADEMKWQRINFMKRCPEVTGDGISPSRRIVASIKSGLR